MFIIMDYETDDTEKMSNLCIYEHFSRQNLTLNKGSIKIFLLKSKSIFSFNEVFVSIFLVLSIMVLPVL
jgi:hypothetical protein